MEKLIPKLIGACINFVAIFSPFYAGKLSMQLFSRPRKGQLKPNESNYLNKAKQHSLPFKDFNIKVYHWKGSKDTILMAHGWESNSFRWKDLIEILTKEDFNVLALDAPAHGGTGNKEFNAILYSECIHHVAETYKPQAIIGHSVGGMATTFALKNHQMNSVDKIMLLGAPDAFSSILNNYENIMGYSKRTKHGNRLYIHKRFGFFPEYFSTSTFVSNLKIDTLIIHDKKDRIIPFSDGINIKNSYPSSQFIETKGYGHGLKSGEVYQHILKFLKA